MFGNAVRTYRQRLGITQAELADRAGVSVRHVQNLEAGRISRPRQSTVRLLADAFDLGRAARDRFWAAALAGAAHHGGAADAPAGSRSGWPRPAQLPPDLPVVGRAGELGRLTALVCGGGRSPTIVIAGMAGVGKTALAVRWAHQVRDRFPDGQLYADLRGFHPTGTALAPAEAIRGFSTRSTCRPDACRRAWMPGSASTAACSPAGGCWSCSTTPAPPTTCARCCPAAPPASWS